MVVKAWLAMAILISGAIGLVVLVAIVVAVIVVASSRRRDDGR